MAQPKNGIYVLYDANGTGDGIGGGAIPMAQDMVNAGFTHVYTIQGGFTAWVNAGYPTVAGPFTQL